MCPSAPGASAWRPGACSRNPPAKRARARWCARTPALHSPGRRGGCGAETLAARCVYPQASLTDPCAVLLRNLTTAPAAPFQTPARPCPSRLGPPQSECATEGPHLTETSTPSAGRPGGGRARAQRGGRRPLERRRGHRRCARGDGGPAQDPVGHPGPAAAGGPGRGVRRLSAEGAGGGARGVLPRGLHHRVQRLVLPKQEAVRETRGAPEAESARSAACGRLGRCALTGMFRRLQSHLRRRTWRRSGRLRRPRRQAQGPARRGGQLCRSSLRLRRRRAGARSGRPARLGCSRQCARPRQGRRRPARPGRAERASHQAIRTPLHTWRSPVAASWAPPGTPPAAATGTGRPQELLTGETVAPRPPLRSSRSRRRLRLATTRCRVRRRGRRQLLLLALVAAGPLTAWGSGRTCRSNRGNTGEGEEGGSSDNMDGEVGLLAAELAGVVTTALSNTCEAELQKKQPGVGCSEAQRSSGRQQQSAGATRRPRNNKHDDEERGDDDNNAFF